MNSPKYRKNARCPWGSAQQTRRIADGIDWISTAGHGGFRLSEERYGEMPEWLRPCSFTGDQFFEEDCSWCAVVLAFPHLFNADQEQAAQLTYTRHYGKKEAA